MTRGGNATILILSLVLAASAAMVQVGDGGCTAARGYGPDCICPDPASAGDTANTPTDAMTRDVQGLTPISCEITAEPSGGDVIECGGFVLRKADPQSGTFRTFSLDTRCSFGAAELAVERVPYRTLTMDAYEATTGQSFPYRPASLAAYGGFCGDPLGIRMSEHALGACGATSNETVLVGGTTCPQRTFSISNELSVLDGEREVLVREPFRYHRTSCGSDNVTLTDYVVDPLPDDSEGGGDVGSVARADDFQALRSTFGLFHCQGELRSEVAIWLQDPASAFRVGNASVSFHNATGGPHDQAFDGAIELVGQKAEAVGAFVREARLRVRLSLLARQGAAAAQFAAALATVPVFCNPNATSQCGVGGSLRYTAQWRARDTFHLHCPGPLSLLGSNHRTELSQPELMDTDATGVLHVGSVAVVSGRMYSRWGAAGQLAVPDSSAVVHVLLRPLPTKAIDPTGPQPGAVTLLAAGEVREPAALAVTALGDRFELAINFTQPVLSSILPPGTRYLDRSSVRSLPVLVEVTTQQSQRSALAAAAGDGSIRDGSIRRRVQGLAGDELLSTRSSQQLVVAGPVVAGQPAPAPSQSETNGSGTPPPARTPDPLWQSSRDERGASAVLTVLLVGCALVAAALVVWVAYVWCRRTKPVLIVAGGVAASTGAGARRGELQS